METPKHICDFCSGEGPLLEYRTTDDPWEACLDCVILIDRGDKLGLENRTVDSFMFNNRGHNESTVREAVKLINTKFWESKV
jgi:hypothetical protein